MFCQDLCSGNWDWSLQKHCGFLKFFHCLLFTYPGSVYTVYEQMPQPVFFLCTVCHYMIHTYNTDSLLSLISVLIAKTTDYTPCRPLRLSEAHQFQRGGRRALRLVWARGRGLWLDQLKQKMKMNKFGATDFQSVYLRTFRWRTGPTSNEL